MKFQKTTRQYDFDTGMCKGDTEAVETARESTLQKQVEANIVQLYPNYTFQTFEGFGCCLNESSCYLLSKMASETRREALRQWFAPEALASRFVRVTVDSCDFSLQEYQAVPDPLNDPELNTFSLKRDELYVIPVLKEALEISGGKLSVLLSPWSPPGDWKTPAEMTQNDVAVYGGMGLTPDITKPSRCFGGRLKPEYYDVWAKYLVKYIQGYLAHGIPVTMLSIQNESSAATYWDSCLWTAAQQRKFLTESLYPAMQAAGLTEKVGIYIWDHNKERMLDFADEVLTGDAEALVQGVAFHWYSGDHFEALELLHRKYPNLLLLRSEGCGLHLPGKPLAFETTEESRAYLPDDMQAMLDKTAPQIDYEDAAAYAHDIIGDLNHGMQRWIDWSMIMDRKGGPRHVPCGFVAPMIAEDDGIFTKEPSFVYLSAIGQAVRPGAVRLGYSRYSSNVEITDVKNSDDSLGVVLLNKWDKPLPVALRFNGELLQMELPPHTLTTLRS